MKLTDALDATVSARPLFAEASKSGAKLSADDVKSINRRWTRDNIEADRLVSFPVLAIDTAPTRNGIVYSAESQKASVKAWVGKTFLFNSTGGADHSLQASSQVGRIFKSQIVTTAQGETGTLVWAYSVRGVSQQTDEFIGKIESGILREVSLHVLVEGVTCSICNVPAQDCEKAHQPGAKYGR